MQFETNAEIVSNLFIDDEYFLEIRQINRNICNYIESFFLFKTENTIMNEIKAEICFRDLIPIIDFSLNYINLNINFIAIKISDINGYITYLNYLKIFSSGVYDKISSKRVNEEEYYLASIPNENMTFYDYEKIKFIQFSKINLSSKDTDTLNILLRNLMESSLKKISVLPKNIKLKKN